MGKNKHNRHANGNDAPEQKIVNEVPDKEVEIADIVDDADGDPTVDADVLGETPEEGDELEALKNMLQQREEALEKEKKEYLFLMADFDNFKKRTLRERSELLRNASESTLKGLLPILDDFERGLAAIKDSSDAESVKQGMELIYNKFVKYLEQNGVKEMATENAAFDPDLHEAVAMVPVEDADKKGHVIDTVQKGYTINDKVLRHAKVAVGQ